MSQPQKIPVDSMPNPPLAARLHWAIMDVCPIHGVRIKDEDDRDTWSFSEKDEATDAEIAAAWAVLRGFDPNAVAEAPEPSASESMLSELEENLAEQKAKIDKRTVTSEPETPPEAIADLFQTDRPYADQAAVLWARYNELTQKIMLNVATDAERDKHSRLQGELDWIKRHAFEGV